MKKLGLSKQQLNDYYYGYNLRLADELGCYEKHIKQPIPLDDKIRLNASLKEDLLEEARYYLFEGRSEEQVVTELFNEPVTELEQELESEFIY